MKTIFKLVMFMALSIGSMFAQAGSVAKTGLPPGLTISDSGLISGTPIKGSAGIYQFKAEVCDSEKPAVCSDPVLFTLVVYKKPTVNTVSPLQPATEGQPYSNQLDGDGGLPPLSWAIQ